MYNISIGLGLQILQVHKYFQKYHCFFMQLFISLISAVEVKSPVLIEEQYLNFVHYWFTDLVLIMISASFHGGTTITSHFEHHLFIVMKYVHLLPFEH